MVQSLRSRRMTYRGEVKNGVVVIEGNPPLPEGAQVQVELVVADELSDAEMEQMPTWDEVFQDITGKAQGLPSDMARNHNHYIHGPRTLGQRMMKFAGTAQGLPADMARNHDHYIRGTPKE